MLVAKYSDFIHFEGETLVIDRLPPIYRQNMDFAKAVLLESAVKRVEFPDGMLPPGRLYMERHPNGKDYNVGPTR